MFINGDRGVGVYFVCMNAILLEKINLNESTVYYLKFCCRFFFVILSCIIFCVHFVIICFVFFTLFQFFFDILSDTLEKLYRNTNNNNTYIYI